MNDESKTAKPNYTKERIAIYGSLLLGGLLVFAMYGGDLFGPSEADARRAISLARSACSTNRFEFERRYLDAEAEISKLPPLRGAELRAVLENELRLVGCKVP